MQFSAKSHTIGRAWRVKRCLTWVLELSQPQDALKMSVHLLKPRLKRVAQYAVLYRVIYAFREYRKGELLPCGKEIAPLGHPYRCTRNPSVPLGGSGSLGIGV